MNMPDFDVWADNIVNEARFTGNGGGLISTALKQAFEQGRALGTREGYKDGSENGWWKNREDGDA